MKIGRKKNEKINGERDFCFPMFFRFDFSSNAKKSKFFRKKRKKKLIGSIAWLSLGLCESLGRRKEEGEKKKTGSRGKKEGRRRKNEKS